jgi:hypothetical protein
MHRFTVVVLIAGAAASLAGCDWIGIDSPEKIAATRLAEGNAVGSACRHAGHAIEDCFALNKKSDKAAIFAGWRDMNDYMREHQIGVVAPQLGSRLANAATGGATGNTDTDGIVIVARSGTDAQSQKTAVAP